MPPNATYPNGTHIAEVEIDPETGVTSIERYTICDDFGDRREPDAARRPGAWRRRAGHRPGVARAHGLRCGRPARHRELDGLLPAARGRRAVLPLRDSNVPSTTNPLGIKGAGEAGSIGSCPAVMNAVVDALDRAYGVRDIDMPATPERVFSVIEQAGRSAAE